MDATSEKIVKEETGGGEDKAARKPGTEKIVKTETHGEEEEKQ